MLDKGNLTHEKKDWLLTKMEIHPETQELVDRMCRNVEREDFELDKKKSEELILQTYDLFGLNRPSRIEISAP